MAHNPFYIAETNKTFAEALTDLRTSVEKHGFTVVNVIDMQENFKAVGKSSKQAVIVHVCNPAKSFHAYSVDKRMLCMMPKSINIYEGNDGKIKFVFMKADADKVDSFFPDNNIKELSLKVSEVLKSMVDAAV